MSETISAIISIAPASASSVVGSEIIQAQVIGSNGHYNLTGTIPNSYPSGANQLVLTIYANGNYSSAVNTYVLWKNIQLEVNSSETSYEQYCGGIPSPNPSYPQDIHNVNGNNSIVVCGKNLYIPTITNNGVAIATGNCNVSVDGDEYTLTATAGDMWFTRAVASGTAYQDSQGVLYDVNNATTLGFLVTNTTLIRNYFTFFDENKVSLGYTRIDSNTGSINVPSGAKYFMFRFGYYNSVSGTSYKTKVMVSYNESENATSFIADFKESFEKIRSKQYE